MNIVLHGKTATITADGLSTTVPTWVLLDQWILETRARLRQQREDGAPPEIIAGCQKVLELLERSRRAA